MSGFVRRFTSLPTLATLLAIEGTSIIDLVPPDPVVGEGSGTVLLMGEFEDGFFATEEEAKGAVEVFGSEDFKTKFGSFGYTYGGVVANHPSARKHLTECWNGNGFLKAFKLKASRLLVSRVDTSVGTVSFDVLASILGGAGPFQLAPGQTLSVTTDTGGPGASAALTAVVATVAGAGAAFATILSGDTFGIKIDGGPQVNVTFSGADITQALALAKINATLGFASAVVNATEIDLRGIKRGTGGSVQLIEVTAGVLAKIGHTVGTTAGVSNIAADIDAVTAAEVVTFVNAQAAITALNARADLNSEGRLRLLNSTTVAASSILVTAGAMATALGLSPIGVAVLRSGHLGGTIPAGTRLRASGTPGLEWVTMQTLDVPAASLDPIIVKVRPGLDDGTHAGIGAGLVDTIVDQVQFSALDVNNLGALTVALTEAQLDNRYLDALNATLDEAGDCRDANFLLIARRSDAVVREGRANAIRATECGLKGRKFITGDLLGTTVAQSLIEVAKWRSDRVFYTTKGWKVQVPQIAERGLAGGVGFTADGIIVVRPDGPLTTICAILPPENNPGEATGLIDSFFEVATDGEKLTIDTYIAWKRAGICAPRVDFDTGSEYQSGVTSSLKSGETTIARRKMADFIQDTLVVIQKPFVKKVATQQRRDLLRGRIDQFYGSLLGTTPDQQRIDSFSVDDGPNAGNTGDVLALGAYFIRSSCRTLSSLDQIVHQTEIGPNANTVTQL
jgi:hypothetical protein